MFGLGLVVGGVLLATLMEKRNITSFVHATKLWALSAAGVVFGGRLFYLLIYGWHGSLLGSFAAASGGEVFYGGLLCGAAVGYFVIRRWALPLGDTLDCAAVAVPFGHAFGRIGCFLGGCCHGKVTSSCIGVRYPRLIDAEGQVVGSPAFLLQLKEGKISELAQASLPVYPVQLFEACFLIGLGILGLWLWSRGALRGRLFFVVVLCYCVWRFIIEEFRVNEEIVLGLTVYQVLSLVIGSAAAVLLLRSKALSSRSARAGLG